MKISRMNKSLFELHQAYDKHTMVPLWPSNGFHVCTGCGYWFDEITMRTSRQFKPVELEMFEVYGRAIGYLFSAVVDVRQKDAATRLRSFARYLQSIGYASNPQTHAMRVEAEAIQRALRYGLKSQAV